MPIVAIVSIGCHHLIPGSLMVMSQPGTHQPHALQSGPASNMPLGARVDSAHPLGDVEVEAAIEGNQPSSDSGVPTPSPDDLSAQLRLQAEQLASELQRRRDELDRRESRLNARDAAQDNEARGLRMWLVERQQELDEHETVLKRRERDVEDRCSQIIAAESFHESSRIDARQYVQKHRALLDRRGAEVDQREQELARREERLDHATAELNRSRKQFDDHSLWQRQQLDVRREASLQLVRLGLVGLERRRQAVEQQAVQTEALRKRLLADDRDKQPIPAKRLLDLERRERLVEEGFELIDQRRAALTDLEQRLKDRAEDQLRQMRRDRQRLITAERQLELRREQVRENFRRRENELDARRTALDQLRESLATSQRESLELRLATEELWNQLTTQFPAPALTASLGRIRAQLADHDRQLRQELVDHRQKLEALRDQLAQQHDRLDEKKREHQAWIERRTRDLDQRTQDLAARQFKLDEQQHAIEHLQHDWCGERLTLQDQAQSLMRQLREAMAG